MPIVLDVGARADDQSFKQVGDKADRYFKGVGENAGKHFAESLADGLKSADADIRKFAESAQKAYNKAADAAGRVVAEEAKMDQARASGNRTRIIAQAESLERAQRAEVAATQAAVTALRRLDEAQRDALNSGTLLSNLLGGLRDGILGSSTQIGAMASSAESLSARLGGISGAAAGATLGVAGIAVGVAAATKALYDLGGQWDDISDGIAVRTGKIGDDLKALTDTVKSLGPTTAAPLGMIGDVAGQVSQSLHLTGGQLTDMTKTLADLNQLTGESTNIRDLGKAFQLFDIPAGAEQIDALNDLLHVSQATGISVNDLIATMQQAGKATKQFGMGFGETAGLVASLEDAGLDFNKVAPSLSIALKNFAAAGREPQQALRDTIAQIKNLADAGRDADAAALASKTFGKGYLDFLNAIKDGSLDVKKFNDAVSGTGPSIEELRDETGDLAEEWQKFTNQLETIFEPAATRVFNNINDLLSGLVNFPRDFRDAMDDNLQNPNRYGRGQVLPGITHPSLLIPGGGGPGAQQDRRGVGGALGPALVHDPGLDDQPGLIGGSLLDPTKVPGGWGPSRWGVTGAKPGTAKFNAPLSQYSLDAIPLGSFAGEEGLLGSTGAPVAAVGPGGQVDYSAVQFGNGGNPYAQPGYGYYEHDPQKVFDAETSRLGAQNSLQNARFRYLEVMADADATEQDKYNAKAALVSTGRALQSAEQKLAEAQQGTWKKLESSAKSFSDGMGQIGAALDNDLGISKGLPGLAENLVKFLANLAAAPVLGALGAVSTVAGDEGSGLVGILGAQGVFGPQYTRAYQQQQQYGYAPYGPGAAGLPVGGGAAYGLPGFASQPGESARDFAHRVMMPFWQSQGLTVGDHAADKYGEHQNGALDIMVDSIAQGNKVLQEVLSDPNVYGAIFNNQTYGYGHGLTPQDYSAGHTGNPTQDHQDHVHAWYKPGGANNITTPSGGGGTPGLLSPQQLTNIVGAEASGNWQANTGNGYFGGPQFSQSTWDEFGGPQYAPRADLATPEQQMDIANRVFAVQGAGAWPATSAAHPEWFQPTGGTGTGAPFPGLGGPPQAGAPAFGIPQPQPTFQSSATGGTPFPANPSGAGPGIGGAPMDALMGAAGGLDMLAPGAGAAAKIGIQEINRAIQFGGQAAGIGVSGLMETLLPSGSPLGSIGNSWFGKLAAGFAGARPALPNMAGQKAAPPAPSGAQGGQQGQAGTTVTNNVTYNNNQATEDRAGADLTRHLTAGYMGPGPAGR